MKLREGGYYRRRDGEVIGPIAMPNPDHHQYPFWCANHKHWYASSGGYYFSGGESPYDLIEEVPAPGSEKPAKRPLQVGDRVAFYTQHGRTVGTVERVGVFKLKVSGDNGGTLFDVHPKQCRRLVKRERHRLWINPSVALNRDWIAPEPVEGWVEYVEVRRK